MNNDMIINWYPGHMAKGLKDIKENATLADVFIIVLDARCPISSYNEDFDAIAPQKPRLFIITKSDLMDKNKKVKIQKRFGDENVLWLDLRQVKSRNLILNKIKFITKVKVEREKAKGMIASKIKVFVLGVPNAGKSTLINLMSQKNSLKVANYPGVTRNKQWIIFDNYYFMDTPGILLPKLEDQEAAVKLALVGSIDINSFPISLLCNHFLEVIFKYYPNLLKNEFKLDLDNIEKIDEVVAYNIFNNIAKNKNFKKDNKVDLDKTYKYFINWVRNLKNVTFD